MLFRSARTHRCHLAEQDVLCNTVAVVLLADHGSFHENPDGLLERAPYESSRTCVIDTAALDGHERSSVGHQVAQKGEMAVVDVGTVELDGDGGS